MVEQSPALKKRIKPVLSQKRLVYMPLASFYQVLSAESYPKHGYKIHGVIFDELHTEKSTEKIDGAVAMIMAMDRCIRNKGAQEQSVYDERGLLVF